MLLIPFSIILLLLCEPALANRFETISSGITGSGKIKREFVRGALLVGGSGFIIAAILAVIVPRNNAAFLNYTNWKQSAIVLTVLGIVLFITRFFV